MSAVHEAREMLAKYERGLAPQDSLICDLLAYTERVEAENAALRKAIAAIRTALQLYDDNEPWTTTSADCDHESCERLAIVQTALAIAQTDNSINDAAQPQKRDQDDH